MLSSTVSVVLAVVGVAVLVVGLVGLLVSSRRREDATVVRLAVALFVLLCAGVTVSVADLYEGKRIAADQSAEVGTPTG